VVAVSFLVNMVVPFGYSYNIPDMF
jgi:hypothetical protein